MYIVWPNGDPILKHRIAILFSELIGNFLIRKGKKRDSKEGQISQTQIGGKRFVGQNTRTCDANENGNGKGTGSCVRLFGVNIASSPEPQEQQPIQKSLSLGNLQALDQEDDSADHFVEAGYLSDGPVAHSRRGKAAHERKKGKPWSEEEHRTFLAGLKRLGKGDWRGISKKFVISRTPTQVASHAQKYFIRHASTDRKKRRSSVFDLPLSEPEASASKATPNLPPVKTVKPLSKAS
ncbi:probable transcription factor At5g61620 [Tripterygium wilfordii]|uniref:probable transcription factor At5g61620 n=1 Tax=Tripterygium wilfordii TaxID=458696 RepID=UPI0018F85FCF|nr:probable transcription factor At5g61620 [Tripterygium wilfordii]